MNLDDAIAQLNKPMPAELKCDPSAEVALASAAADGLPIVVDLAGGLADASGDVAGGLLEVLGSLFSEILGGFVS